MASNSLDQFLSNNKKKLLYPEPVSTYFSTEYFIFHAQDSIRQHREESFRILDTLCKKIDVIGTVYSQYNCQFQATEKRECISKEHLTHLCAIYILASLVFSDLKFLNTAFKMIETFFEINDEKDFLHNIAQESLDVLFKKTVRSTQCKFCL